MRKHSIYSESRRRSAAPGPVTAAPKHARISPKLRRRLTVASAIWALLAVVAVLLLRPAPVPPPPEDAETPAPFSAAEAAEAVRPSVVQVRGFRTDTPDGNDIETSLGTGVIILESGVILTNLHVVHGAQRVQVTFHDGLVSEATVTGVRAEHDLAVVQAARLPDDIVPATLRPTAGLVPGDPVVAVGFPFGIGPSVTSGVISGLGREFRSLKGERILTNLIQFDAAVNPGNSGGPLVTGAGEVVGIVTGIMNPTEQRFFVGIGFAVPIENAAAAVGIPPF